MQPTPFSKFFRIVMVKQSYLKAVCYEYSVRKNPANLMVFTGKIDQIQIFWVQLQWTGFSLEGLVNLINLLNPFLNRYFCIHHEKCYWVVLSDDASFQSSGFRRTRRKTKISGVTFPIALMYNSTVTKVLRSVEVELPINKQAFVERIWITNSFYCTSLNTQLEKQIYKNLEKNRCPTFFSSFISRCSISNFLYSTLKEHGIFMILFPNQCTKNYCTDSISHFLFTSALMIWNVCILKAF